MGLNTGGNTLFGTEEKELMNAKVRCVKSGTTHFTEGKIYEVVDGIFVTDYGLKVENVHENSDILKNGDMLKSRFELVTETPNYWQNITKINQKQEAKGASKYGETLENNTTLSTTQRIEHLQEELIDGLKYCEHLKQTANDNLTANDYQRMAMRTIGTYENDYKMLCNAVYGLNGEAGEVIDLLKKHEFQGHELDKNKLIDEAGDVAWYLALLASALGVTLQDVLMHNVEKLKARYPDGFSKDRSINREENNEK